MGFFEGLIAFVVILVVSFILSAIVGAMISNGKDNSGGATMLLTFIVSVAFISWIVFFV